MIRLISSIPSVPLPDPLWYEYLQEVLPDQPEETLDIVELTRDAERVGLTLIDIILYNSGKSLNATLPLCRQALSDGLVLVVSDRDIPSLRDVGVDVQCYEDGHPRDWVRRYPNRLWVSRFWFGSIWFYHLGVEHLIVDIPILTNRAWVSPLARLLPVQIEAPIHEAHVRVVEILPELLRYLIREWSDVWHGQDRPCVAAG